MRALSRCGEHGFFDRAACPVCDGDGTVVLGSERRRRLSTYLSGALRHFPQDAGLTLNDAGWTAFDALVDAAVEQYDWATRAHVAAVVATDPNGRFERTGGDLGTDVGGESARVDDADCDRVRAAYGHSVPVRLEAGGTPVPETLYHGTAPRNRESILADGLVPMSRQLVHLSDTVQAATRVGARHAGDPLVFEVDAAAMSEDGHQLTRRGRATYTTERVPPGYLSVHTVED